MCLIARSGKFIQNELTQIISDIGFIEFVNQNEKPMFIMPDDIILELDEDIVMAAAEQKEHFRVVIDLNTIALVQDLINNFANMKQFLHFKYDIHRFTIELCNSQVNMLVLKPDLGIQYLSPLFTTKVPFNVKFNNDSGKITCRNRLSTDFQLNATEITLIKKYITIGRFNSALFAIYILQKSIKETSSLEFKAISPDKTPINLDIFYNILKMKLAQELYNVLY